MHCIARIKAIANTIDPDTGKPLTPGVTCIGPIRYRARKLIEGKRQSKVHRSDEPAKQWLEDRSVETRCGNFVDRRSLDKLTVVNLVQRYVDERMQDGGLRRGARKDREGHIPAILNDKKFAALKLSMLADAEVQGFADCQAAKYAPSTVVERLNSLATILGHAIRRWKIPLPSNPATADAVPRPEGADLKRERRLLVPSAGDHRRAAAPDGQRARPCSARFRCGAGCKRPERPRLARPSCVHGVERVDFDDGTGTPAGLRPDRCPGGAQAPG